MNKSISFITLDLTLRGGIERFVANMSEIFANQDIEVSIYSLHKSHDQSLYKISKKVKIIYLSDFKYYPRLYKFTSILSCIKLLFILSKNKNHQIFISTFPIITIILAFLKKSFLSNVIASEHSTYLAHNKIVRTLRLWAYKYVLCVVTQTNDGMEKFSDAGIRCRIIPNPATDFNDLRQWSFDDQVLNLDSFRCLSVARFEEVKQLDHYIEVARIVHKAIPEARFTLIGSGPLELKLRQLIEKYRLSDVFEILPPTPDVNKYYASSHVYLITSSSEAFPMTLIEALSFGLPVISYDGLVGPIEIIQNGCNGYLCQQNNPQAIAKHIHELYLNQHVRKEMRRKALDSSFLFSPNKILEKWADIL